MGFFNTPTVLAYTSVLFLVHLSVGYGVYHLFWKKRKHRAENDGAMGMMLGFFAGTWILLYFLGVAAILLAGSFSAPENPSVTNDCQNQVTQLKEQQSMALETYRNFEDKDSEEAQEVAQEYLSVSLTIAATLESSECAE